MLNKDVAVGIILTENPGISSSPVAAISKRKVSVKEAD